MQVEDHPVDYFDFEGVIPAGNYGGGEVIVWDWGTYALAEGDDAAEAIRRGRLKIQMHGEKLKGLFTLVKMKGRGGAKDNAWLLFKDADDAADPAWTVEGHGESVKTGRSVEELRGDDRAPKWISKPSANERGKQRATPTERGKNGVQKETVTRTPMKKGTKKAKADPIARAIEPELATLIEAPFDDDDWLFEIKWDGFRAVTTIDAEGRVRMLSRNGKDFVARFPELASIGKNFRAPPLVVDGEIVAFDEEGRSSFQRLQNGANAKITYVVFDAIYAEGRDLRHEPLETRKEILRRLVREKAKDVVYSAHVVGKGKEMFEAARARGLEGIVGKRRTSTYVEKRTRDWVKIKAQLEQECVIAGYTEPGGARSGFGSLVLGVYEAGKLVYCGNVGTGFDGKTLASLLAKLKALETKGSPFASAPKTRTRAHWVKPTLVAQIRFTEWTRDGSMRHPAFLGLRDDKAPKRVRRERPQRAAEVA
jgi:bifunctional non-homologous end joining protein LigD